MNEPSNRRRGFEDKYFRFSNQSHDMIALDNSQKFARLTETYSGQLIDIAPSVTYGIPHSRSKTLVSRDSVPPVDGSCSCPAVNSAINAEGDRSTDPYTGRTLHYCLEGACSLFPAQENTADDGVYRRESSEKSRTNGTHLIKRVRPQCSAFFYLYW